MIERLDFVVKIDGVQVTDVQLDSININHTVDEQSTAEFILSRKHDQLDYTVDGNFSQITNNNQVDIYIDGHHEFISGKISNISTNSETETVSVIAKSSEKKDNRKIINIPLASLNEKLHPYQVLLHNPIIDNFYFNSIQVIRGQNGKIWTGTTWSDNIDDAIVFSTFELAFQYLKYRLDYVKNNPNSNTYDNFINKSPYVDNYDENPEVYMGVKANLGTITIQNYSLWYNANGTWNAEDIINGDFELLQNWSYFWTMVEAENFLTGVHRTYFYIGTSLGSVSSDLWNLIEVAYYRQRQFDDKIYENIGYYIVGEAPYLEISPKNGRYEPDYHVEDRTNGLYGVHDDGYNYIGGATVSNPTGGKKGYLQKIVDIEYNKLKSVGGEILPKTTCDLEIMLDGYYYYNPSLLTRINITNTTTSDIYKNNNGFPVSIKTIEISSQTMRVSFRTDNSLSAKELKELEGQYPDEDSDEYKFDEKVNLIYLKSDPTRDAKIE